PVPTVDPEATRYPVGADHPHRSAGTHAHVVGGSGPRHPSAAIPVANPVVGVVDPRIPAGDERYPLGTSARLDPATPVPTVDPEATRRRVGTDYPHRSVCTHAHVPGQTGSLVGHGGRRQPVRTIEGLHRIGDGGQ